MTDDDLRARLRGADPAIGLAPLSPARVTRLLEDSMTNDLDTSRTAVAAPAPAPPRRTARRFAVAAAGLVLIAGAVATGVALRSPDAPAPGPRAHIVVAGGGAAKCAPPRATSLAAASLAFAGTVQRVAAGTAVLTVTHLYAGAPAEVVEVAQGDGNSEALIGASVFEPGRAYLVAAIDGQAMVCGYSGLATPELQALYDAAF